MWIRSIPSDPAYAAEVATSNANAADARANVFFIYGLGYVAAKCRTAAVVGLPGGMNLL